MAQNPKSVEGIMPRARAYLRQVFASVRKNFFVQARNRTSCVSLFVLPILMIGACTPLCSLMKMADNYLSSGVLSIQNFTEDDIPTITKTLAYTSCLEEGHPCSLAIAPDNNYTRSFGKQLADFLYDPVSMSSVPLLFFPNRSTLKGFALNNLSGLFGGLWLGENDPIELYMRGSILPLEVEYASPVASGSITEINASRYLTSGFLTIQRALNVVKSKLNTNSAIGSTVRTLAFSMLTLSATGNTIGVLVSMMHIFSFSGLVQVSLLKLVEEKNNKTREFLFMLGLRKSAYWISWLLTFLFYVCFIDVLFIACVWISGVLKPGFILPLACNMVAFGVTLVISFFSFQSLFSSNVILTTVSSLYLVIPVLAAYIMPIDKTLHTVFSLLFSPFGYFLSVSQFVASSMNSSGVTEVSQASFFFFFLVNAVFLAIISWYLNKVLPSKYGVHEHPLFLLRPQFWRSVFSRCLPSKDAHYSLLLGSEDPDDSDVKEHDPAFEEQDLSRAAVRIVNLVKSFDQDKKDPVLAVNDVTACFCNGNITALLGENGAGKSTLISTLCGLFSPTSGNAFVNGKSIRCDMNEIRSMLGVCPQDDVLFPSMTAVEHVNLVAAIKNIEYPDGMNAKSYANHVLHLCGVHDEEHNGGRVESMSGGMKRKLSLTMALVGEPRVLFLDEPTSGVDAVAKRSIWKTLTELKQNRTMILTTHSMEEADALSDYIYIMHEGRMKTGGTPLFLKNRCGVGCYLNIDLQPHSGHISSITALVQENIPGSRIYDQSPSTVSYLLPNSETNSYAKLLHQLDDSGIKSSFGISSYGISLCTMNDVFIRMCSPEGTVSSSFGGVESSSTTTTTTTTTSITTKPSEKNDSITVLPDDSCYAGKASFWRQFVALFKAKLLYYFREKTSIGTLLFMPLFQALLFIVLMTVSVDKSVSARGITDFVLSKSLYVNKEFPVFLGSSLYDNATLNSFVSCMSGTFKSEPVFYTDYESTIGDLISKSGYIYGLYVDKFLSTDADDINITVMYNATHFNSLPNVMDAAYICLGKMAGAQNWSGIEQVGSVSTNAINDAVGFDLMGSCIIICCLFGIVSTSWHPMQKLVEEREKGFKQQILIAGCRPVVFVLASVASSALSLVPSAVVVLVLLMCVGTISFSLLLLLLLAFVLFAVANALFNYWVSLFFDKPSSATTVMSIVSMWLIAIPMLCSVIISVVLIASGTLFSSTTEFLLRLIQFVTEFIPQFAFMNTVISTTFYPADYPFSMLVSWKSKYSLDLVALTLDCVIFFVLSMAREYKADAIEEPHPRYDSPTFGADRDIEREYNRVTSSSSHKDAMRVKRIGKIYVPESKCCKCSVKQDKTKPDGPVNAVKDVTFGAPQNECFGILGPNGSGKTTTMKMVTAELDATFGQIELAGVVQQRSRQQYYTACHIGNCPQSSGCLDYMTAREHLTLVLSMRGGADGTDVPMGVLKNDVTTVLDVMDIGDHSDRQSKTYSGGFVRRLNVAAALLPGVRVIILDEPSTGMDVVSQRALWKAIRQQRTQSGKVVLLTTHSMEEAEAVCSRIAIILQGSLECYGSVQHLRDKYSDGHLVTLFVRAADFKDELIPAFANAIESAKVCQHAEKAVVTHTPSSVQLTYKLTGIVSLASLFDTLDDIRSSNQPAVQQYTVSQASLESVFVHMIQERGIEE